MFCMVPLILPSQQLSPWRGTRQRVFQCAMRLGVACETELHGNADRDVRVVVDDYG